MLWRNLVASALDMTVRVPPLFVMDSILNKKFLNYYMPYEAVLTWGHLLYWLTIMTAFFLLAVIVFCLESPHLREFYSYFLSFAVLFSSYWINRFFVSSVYDRSVENHINEHVDKISVWNLTVKLLYGTAFSICMQLTLAQLFIVLRTTRQSYKFYQNNNKVQVLFQSFIFLSLCLPVTVRWFFPDFILFQWTPAFSLFGPILQLVIDFYSTICFTYSKINLALANAYLHIEQRGIQSFLSQHWDRLQIPKVLRIFFCMRLIWHIAFHVTQSENIYKSMEKDNSTIYSDTQYTDLFSWTFSMEIIKTLLVDSCNTIVALLGLTSMVSLVMYYIGRVMSLCLGTDTEEDKTIGTVSAVLFFILALQTGLTGLDPEQRLIRLYRNFCLLSTSVLHFVHGMVNPQLLALSASPSISWSNHARALGMCVYLISFPICLLIYLWTYHTVTTWLLAVTAFCIEVILKVIFSLLVYSLFMIDTYRQVFWEELDDYVYYVQSTGNTIEFLFGIFLFCNGAWIMLFESGGAIRAFMMCIHAYFNIWLQAKEGWKVFIRRRTAVNKMNSLPEATKEQLEENNDVCSICYQDLLSARITKCNHFFHSVCLRKWLYVQDTCPLCHKQVYPSENGKETNSSVQEPQPEAVPLQNADHIGAIPLHYNVNNDRHNNNQHMD